MKYFLSLFIGIFAFSTPLFAGSFANLDEICSLVQDGSKTEKIGGQPPVLPHINNRITTVENFVRHEDMLYMNANTFTDKYRYLGSYLMGYDCSTPHSKLIRLSGVMRAGLGTNELGFIRDMNEYGIVMAHSGNGVEKSLSFYSVTHWVYDFQTQKTSPISHKKTSWYKKVAPAYVGVIENTFDGNCLTLKIQPLLKNNDGVLDYGESFDQEYCIR